jgi:hypothetical protein
MAARRGVVIDRHGRVVEDDDGVVRDGQKLRVPVEFMDAEQRRVFADGRPGQLSRSISDAQRLRALDAWLDMRERTGAGMRRHCVVTPEPTDMADGEQFDHARAAYDALKKRLSGAHKARKARKVADPVWGQV